MFKNILSKISGSKADPKGKSSEFSKFFREASSREKKRVFLDVAKKASEEQLKVIQSVQLAH